MATLKDFLKEYIKTQKLQNSKEEFNAWTAKYGNDAVGNASKMLSALNADYAKSLPSHGAGAERLADMGLAGSGYGEYLAQSSKRLLSEGKRKVEESYAEDLKRNDELYSDYSEKYDVSLQKLKSSVISDIEASGTLDYDTAYLFAINAGLPDEEAMAAATSGSELAKNKARAIVYDAIVDKVLTSGEAFEFSRGLGFTEEEARKLAEFAKNYRGFRYGGGDRTYAEYLRERLEKLKKKGNKIF